MHFIQLQNNFNVVFNQKSYIWGNEKTLNMKKTILSIFSLLVIATIFISSSNGRTDGRSGSPGDNSDCGACHGGSSASSTDMIATDIPTSGYFPETTYNITITVAETGRSEFGFQVTAEDDSNAKIGTFGTGGNTAVKTDVDDMLVTHATPGTTANAQSWVMEWTAPVAGSGNVTFYAAGNASDNTGDTGGDNIYTDSEAVIEDLAAPVCTISVTVTATDASTNGGSDGSASAAITGGQSTITYLWDNGATTASITGITAGTYCVTVMDDVMANCSVTSCSTIGEPLSIGSVIRDNTSLTLSPNPTSSYFTISGTLSNSVTVSLYDLKGSLVKTFVHNNSYDVSDLGKGTYFVHVVSDNESNIKKLIIQ